MLTGLDEDLEAINDARKTAVIDMELSRLNIDVAALQETRLPESGSIKERHYTFFWQGKETSEPRLHGVGFAIRNELIHMIEPPTHGTERILTLKMNTNVGPVKFVCVYAPTMCSPPDVKDQFYELLDDTIKQIPKSEHSYILGDFNARVGSDHRAWSSNLGHFGVGKMNENGQRLLEICSFHELCVTNTFFKNKPQHQVSWRHPRSKQWHQLDMIITKRKMLHHVKNTRTYHSADCNTDHSLVVSSIKIIPKKFHRTRNPGNPRIDVNYSWLPSRTEKFTKLFTEEYQKNSQDDDESINATENWNTLRKTIYSAAMAAYGKKTRNNSDWYETNIAKMEPVIEAKRTALTKYKNDPSSSNLQLLRNARTTVKRTARQCANDYWLKLCDHIQVASETGHIRGMYEGIKQATGIPVKKTAPLKSKTGETITDSKQQMDRWVEHYLELYSRETSVSQEALDAIPNLPVMEELDATPTVDELEKAINSLKSRKAPGNDSIPPEVIKQGKSVLLGPLHKLLCMCWKEGKVPQDMRDAKIITLYKNKGERSDCNNYRGISLLSIVGKVFARVALNRLQKLAERIYPESQCGFRAERSTIDMIFAVRQIQEKCREQQLPLHMAFIDLTKAFDLVSRRGLFQLLERIGCPPQLLSIVTSFHEDMNGTVSYDGQTSESFGIRSGVKQGCVLAPTLFGIFFSLLLSAAFKDSEEGIHLHTRSDGKLFNLARLKAKTKVRRILVRELLFADDAAVVSHSEEHLQQLIDKFAQACNEFGLTISIKKTNVMGQGTNSPPNIFINNEALDVAESFTYLGSTITNNLTLNPELDRRIAKASAVMSRLNKKVWSNKQLTVNTKLKVYQACVLSTLLYGAESWTTYATQENRLECFHLRNLRRILNIHWQDKITNTEVLERAKILSIHTLLTQRRLRWLGHVHRMQDGRIPKDVLYGELAAGKRPAGRPSLRFRDVCKRDMIQTDIDVLSWEEYAGDRGTWRSAVKEGLRKGEEKRQRQISDRRARRKERKAAGSAQPTEHLCVVCKRDCHSRIGLLSHQRRH